MTLLGLTESVMRGSAGLKKEALGSFALNEVSTEILLNFRNSVPANLLV
jgi:hypothetical protein